MQLNELRKELKFNADLLGLVDTLKNVAGAQYHQLEKQKERFDDFMNAFHSFFRVINLMEEGNPLVEVMSDTLGIIVVTSDSGFMGGLNQGVIRAALEAQGDLPPEKIAWIVIGDKGGSTFTERRRKFKFFSGINQDTIYEQSIEIKNYLLREAMAKRIGKLVIAYPKSLSFSSQSIEVVSLLPCKELFNESKSAGNAPVIEETKGPKWLSRMRNVIIESKVSDMAEYLAGVWITSKLFEVFEDSKLAEFSARAMHLEGSVQKVQKEYKKVKHLCFKATHELIDKGMRESFAAKNIKEKKKKKKERNENK